MTGPFREEVDRIHETAASIVGTSDARRPGVGALEEPSSRPGELDEEVAEIFAERSYREQLTLSYGRRSTRGEPSELYSHDECVGVGLRLLGPSTNRFATVDSLDSGDLEEEALEVFELGARPVTARDPSSGRVRGSVDLPADTPDEVSLQEKRHLLRAAADAAMSLEPNLQDLEVSFQGYARRTGVWATDIQPTRAATSHVGIRVFASTANASTHAVGGGPGGVGVFLEESPESIAQRCIERLRALSDARPSQELHGDVPVVLEGGWGGVWLHETVGHLLEADTESPLASMSLGTRIGTDQVTVIDDGTMAGGRANCAYDDEGLPSERTILVERGRLRRLMTDRWTALRRGTPRTPNGRRENYRFQPLPRMTNLCLANGSTPTADLVADVKRGLYIRTIGSGEVRPAEDRFHFDVLEGYVIEHGHLAAPVRPLRVSGRPAEMLHRVAAVGDDFKVDPARGACVKDGQTVPVSVGMPTVLLHTLTVGPVP